MHLPFIKETKKSNAYVFLFFFLTKKKDKYMGQDIEIFFRDTIVPILLFYRGSKCKNCVVTRSKGWFFILLCVFLYLWFQKTSSLIGHFMISVYTDIQNPNPPHLATGLLIYIVNNQVGLKIVFLLQKKRYEISKNATNFFPGKI